MSRLVLVLGVLAVPGVLALRASPAGAEGGTSIKAIMKELNGGPTALSGAISQELRGEDTDWASVKKLSGQVVADTEALRKLEPPRGDKDSWDRLTKSYAGDAKALADAAGKEEKASAKAAQARLTDMKTCASCHGAHRVRKQ
jgi:hypothetical protein